MDELVGVEIKGEGDSTARLALQGMQYSAVCTRMFLLPCEKLRDRCERARPPGWLMARNKAGAWWQRNPPERQGAWEFGDLKTLPTSPLRLVEMLWGDEVRQLCTLFDIDAKVLRGQARLEAIANTVPLAKLRASVYRRLYRRRWESGQLPKRVWRPDVPAA